MTGEVAELSYALGWRLVRMLPGPIAARLFRAGGDLAARRGGPGVRQLRANLARVLGHGDRVPRSLDTAELDAVVVAAMRSYARYWCEAFRLPAMAPSLVHELVSPGVHGIEYLGRALSRGRGVIAALTHSGNWDVAGVWLVRELSRLGEPATLVTVAERLHPESVYERFLAYRRGLGFEVLPADRGAWTVATLAARLRANRVVCLLADRDVTGAGIEVDFFGAPARLPAGPAALARRTGATLVPFAGWFTPDGWGLRFHPPIEPPSGEPTSVVVHAVTQALADVFTRDIASHPADWHMLQPIWISDWGLASPRAQP